MVFRRRGMSRCQVLLLGCLGAPQRAAWLRLDFRFSRLDRSTYPTSQIWGQTILAMMPSVSNISSLATFKANGIESSLVQEVQL